MAAETVEELVQLDSFDSIFSLKGKVAVVTGGSRGLGLQAASGFIQAGCSKVYILARTEGPLLEAAAALNNLKPPFQHHKQHEAIPIVCDVSSADDLSRAAAQVAKTSPAGVDILLANAGATYIAPLDSYSESEFARVMHLNVTSVFFSVQKFTPLLSAASGNAPPDDPSRVILVSSVAGVVIGDVGRHGTYAYAASKAAVNHLCRNLAVELGPRGINVNVVAPGTVPSKMSENLLGRHGGVEGYASQVPDRKLGTKEDVAGTMVYMCSRAARHVNGATLVLDGGSFLVRGCP